MAGIYLHIPFCKSRCIYCDFYSTLKINSIESYVTALSEELKQRKDYLQGPIKTIYLGGGTPSLLSYKQLGVLFKNLDKHYNLSAVKEVTLEANPDDLTPDYLNELKKLPINR
ncbi:MAG: radical SAM protein, partial [Bacteroides sp.]|nr:radical SAM protein [Bacteroides sp.]